MPPKAAAPWSPRPASSQSSFPQFVERREVLIDFMIFTGCAAVNPPSDELLRRPARRTLGHIAIVSSKLFHPAPGQISFPVGSHSDAIQACRYCDSELTPA